MHGYLQRWEKLLHAKSRQLLTADWSPVIDEGDVNAGYKKFLDILSEKIKITCPKKTFRNTGYNDHRNWINDDIRQKSVTKRILYEDMLCGVISPEKYKSFCKGLQKEVHHLKRTANTKFITDSRNKTHATWKLVKQITGKTIQTENCANIIRDISLSSETCLQLKLTSINQYLVDSCEKFEGHLPLQINLQRQPNSLFLKPTTPKGCQFCWT